MIDVEGYFFKLLLLLLQMLLLQLNTRQTGYGDATASVTNGVHLHAHVLRRR